MNVTLASVGTSPTLIFSGQGRVVLEGLATVRIGGPTLNPSDPSTYVLLSSLSGSVLDFCSPTDIYGFVTSSTSDVKTVNWF
jgi:hypothetical protein